MRGEEREQVRQGVRRAEVEVVLVVDGGGEVGVGCVGVGQGVDEGLWWVCCWGL